jgi:hypothetical protein
VPVVSGTGSAHRLVGTLGAYQWHQLGGGLVNHEVGSLFSAALSVASPSKSAESCGTFLETPGISPSGHCQ